MLGLALKLLRPSYALTGLLLFGGYQGYSLVKSATAPLRPGRAAEQRQLEQVSGSADAAVADGKAEEVGRLAAAIQRVHPATRMVSWIVIYGLNSKTLWGRMSSSPESRITTSTDS